MFHCQITVGKRLEDIKYTITQELILNKRKSRQDKHRDTDTY